MAAGMAMGAAGCDEENMGSRPSPARGSIDVSAGTYADAGIGGSRASVQKRLGSAPGRGDSPELSYEVAPLFLPGGNEPGLVYGDAQFMFERGRVVAVVIYGRAARTERGVQIGARLAEARSAYRAHCERPRDAGEGRRLSARCHARVGRTYVYFGGDPIRLIALSRDPFAQPR